MNPAQQWQLVQLMADLASPAQNTNTVALQRIPKIAVYSPDGAQPWDDAVTMVLEYADIPFTTIYDTEILDGSLGDYQWLHLHHEDFTGQYGKFYGSYRDAAWYINQKASFEAAAREMGYAKVSQQKRRRRSIHRGLRERRGISIRHVQCNRLL